MIDSNSNSGWTDSDGIELKRSRESAGNDVYSFARQNNLSTHQLLELEEGGNSYFYTTSIKYNVGKKLLNSLGQKTESQRQSELAKTRLPKDTEVVDTRLDDPIHQDQTRITPNNSNSIRNYIFATAFIVFLISCVFVIYTNQTNQAPNPSQQLVISQVSASAPSANTESVNNAIEIRNSLEESTTVKATATTTANPSKPNECTWSDASVDVSATTASKEGNYVYLVATNELVVCIKDAHNIQTTVLLKPDQPQNIAATPPIKIYSANLNNINIFYQGSKIQLPKQGITEISLIAKSWQ
jgi:cytoskeleton protein RodZ